MSLKHKSEWKNTLLNYVEQLKKVGNDLALIQAFYEHELFCLEKVGNHSESRDLDIKTVFLEFKRRYYTEMRYHRENFA